MKPFLFPLAGAVGLLLGSAAPPAPRLLLPVDPAVFEDPSGCPEGAGADCILLDGGEGEIVLMGLPRPVAPASGDEVASAPPAVPASPAWTASPVRVVISLPQQKAYVFRGSDLVATSPVSTGRPGHRPPVRRTIG